MRDMQIACRNSATSMTRRRTSYNTTRERGKTNIRWSPLDQMRWRIPILCLSCVVRVS